MADTLLASAARVLLLGHAAAAIVLIGSSTHQSLTVIAALRGNVRARLLRIYAATMLIAYAITFSFGALVYPTFRYHVRAIYLDRHAAWASNLFDMKENFAALGLPLVVGAFFLGRVFTATASRAILTSFAACVFLTTAIVWFDVIAGLLITMARGV